MKSVHVLRTLRTGSTDLVIDHVAEALVVDYADVDVGREFLACDAAVHGLVTVVVVSRLEI
jgi:hypothetical protein